MKDLIVSQDIYAIAEFKKHASRLFRQVHDDKRPVLVTQNGTPVGVVIPPEEYDRIVERARFMEAVERGLREADAGLLMSPEEVDRELDREFGPLKRGRRT
ncbi:MAG: type II toxin-antitoxin system Phd/YefM family antitoxin [Deltaproteobacteria bacterium]|nr:type II toxin-antitoxin system Phd/YefM family antitoxin [Deltaproteobacteria bacterium]